MDQLHLSLRAAVRRQPPHRRKVFRGTTVATEALDGRSDHPSGGY
jgi:hypothetical protein